MQLSPRSYLGLLMHDNSILLFDPIDDLHYWEVFKGGGSEAVKIPFGFQERLDCSNNTYVLHPPVAVAPCVELHMV